MSVNGREVGLPASSEFFPPPHRRQRPPSGHGPDGFHRQSSELTHIASNCASHLAPQHSVETSSSSDTMPPPRLPQHLLSSSILSRGSAVDTSQDATLFYRIVYKGVVALLKFPDTNSPRTGSYLSYGEIFCGGRSLRSENSMAVKVHSVLTGGYAVDAKTENELACLPASEQPNAALISGYVFLEQSDIVIAVPIQSIPIAESGTFQYRVISSTPLPILTGPVLDAPRTKAVVLPGTVQDISVRIRIDSDVCFLRLCHRRGWIADRKVSSKNRFQPSVAVVKELNWDSDTHSADGSSVVSDATCLSVKSRHRPPRRRRDATSKDGEKTMPRQIVGKPMMQQSKQVIESSERSIAPSSNVSILSDDSSQTHPSTSLRQSQPASPDASFATNKSASSSSNRLYSTQQKSTTLNYYLMRVTAPRGLKILDAPQFQVSRLIRSSKPQHAVASSHMVSQMESNAPKLHHSIFQTMSGRLTTTGPSQAGNPAVFDASSKSRLLPRGSLFESSTRMETTGSYSQGVGLIKLSDNSGWAVVPPQSELDEQYRKFTGGTEGVKEGEATRAYEEVGSAVLDASSSTSESPPPDRKTTWLRVMSRTGLTVSCPPMMHPENDEATSPTSSRGSSAIAGSNHGPNAVPFQSNDSDVASSVGSSFLDAMFRTPKKRDPDVVNEPIPRANPEKLLQSNTIPCGSLLAVEQWACASTVDYSTREYARLCGGQGWVPLTVAGKPATARVSRPEFRYGSFWFRVQSSRGLRVRLGPSRRAPSIRSDDGVYFRFECGEFLRASEIVTLYSETSDPIESFVKLYRNRHVRLHLGQVDIRQLASFTTQAEWVQADSDNEIFLKECTSEPLIERHKQGWRYNVVPDNGVGVRKGPSFAAEKTGILLFGGESVVINERVTPAEDKITWLRMKDGQGWIHDFDDAGEQIMIAHSLRHRAQSSRPRKPAVSRESNEIAYDVIIARLFHNDDGCRPTTGIRGVQR